LGVRRGLVAASELFTERGLLFSGFGCVLVAHRYDNAELHYATERAGSNVRTSWVVAEIFSEQFFAPVWSLKARLDRYLRNGESPNRIL
jgi:hypothetical protein